MGCLWCFNSMHCCWGLLIQTQWGVLLIRNLTHFSRWHSYMMWSIIDMDIQQEKAKNPPRGVQREIIEAKILQEVDMSYKWCSFSLKKSHNSVKTKHTDHSVWLSDTSNCKKTYIYAVIVVCRSICTLNGSANLGCF